MPWTSALGSSPRPASASPGGGVGMAIQSRESKPEITSSMSARSPTVRVIGPVCAREPNGLAG